MHTPLHFVTAIVFSSCCVCADSDDATMQGETGKVGKNSKQHIGFRMGSLQSTGSGLIGTGHASSGMNPDTPARAQLNFLLFINPWIHLCGCHFVTLVLITSRALCVL